MGYSLRVSKHSHLLIIDSNNAYLKNMPVSKGEDTATEERDRGRERENQIIVHFLCIITVQYQQGFATLGPDINRRQPPQWAEGWKKEINLSVFLGIPIKYF